MTYYPGFRGPDMGGDPALNEDDAPDPSRTYWTTLWDYVGGDDGDLPWEFTTEAEAREAGQEWVSAMAATVALDPDPPGEGEEGWPVYHVVRHVVWPDGGRTAYDEAGKAMYAVSPEGDTYRDGRKVMDRTGPDLGLSR